MTTRFVPSSRYSIRHPKIVSEVQHGELREMYDTRTAARALFLSRWLLISLFLFFSRGITWVPERVSYSHSGRKYIRTVYTLILTSIVPYISVQKWDESPGMNYGMDYYKKTPQGAVWSPRCQPLSAAIVVNRNRYSLRYLFF